MMIDEKDKLAIQQLGSKYGVKRMLLFGSSAINDRQAEDIDLGVEGIASDKFFSFYGDLIFSLSKPVDLVDLSKDSKFNRMILNEGIVVYG